MNDTSPEMAEMLRARLMALSGVERMEIASRMFDAAREMVLASFPAGLSETEIRIRLCERLYGDEVNQKGFAEHLRALERAALVEEST
ncbi:MAG TPA: hypothetical protein VEZ90_07185 [Blastocatellia bacterium]|nr:hypothetical protein [Blastocatellia bacterium]